MAVQGRKSRQQGKAVRSSMGQIRSERSGPLKGRASGTRPVSKARGSQ